jgi:hypothetical protein
MRKTALSVLLIFVLFASGCLFAPVNTAPLKDRQGVRFINSEEVPISIHETNSDTEHNTHLKYVDGKVEPTEPVRVKYNWFYHTICRNIVVSKLQFGEQTIRNAKIYIIDEQGWWGDEILVGMGYFQDTVVVLDFESKLLWVKK